MLNEIDIGGMIGLFMLLQQFSTFLTNSLKNVEVNHNLWIKLL